MASTAQISCCKLYVQQLALPIDHTAGRRCSLAITDASNFISIVVFGLGAPFTGTLCAVTLRQTRF